MVLLLRPFVDEVSLQSGHPGPGAPTINAPLAGAPAKLRQTLGDDVQIVALWNDRAAQSADTNAVDFIIVPSGVWRQVASITAKASSAIVMVLSSRAGDSVGWELALLEAQPDLCDKTIVVPQRHGWLAYYEKALPKSALEPSGSLDKMRATDERFWLDFEGRYPTLAAGAVDDMDGLSDRLATQLGGSVPRDMPLR